MESYNLKNLNCATELDNYAKILVLYNSFNEWDFN